MNDRLGTTYLVETENFFVESNVNKAKKLTEIIRYDP